MSLFRQSLRPPAVLSDEAVERYLAGVRAGLEPDPLFRRRLRGSVLNEYVAVREGMRPRHRPATMGRLGRAVLVASFTLLLGVGSAMAASQAAVPGDALYPFKRQVEALRMQALPAHLHDDLMAHELRSRIAELEVLVERGDSELVTAQVDAIETGYRAFIATLPPEQAAALEKDQRVVVLAALAHGLDEPVRSSVESILDAGGSNDGTGGGTGSGRSPSAGGPVPGFGAGEPAPTARPSTPARQDPGQPSEHPGRTPQPRPTDDPDDASETPRPTPRGSTPSEPEPDPTPRGQGPGNADPGS